MNLATTETPAQEARRLVTDKKRIQVVWCAGTAWNFYDSPSEANYAVAILILGGFTDAHVNWSNP